MSLSSTGSGDMNFLSNSFNANGEELVNVFSSLELSQLLQSQNQSGLLRKTSASDAQPKTTPAVKKT